MPLYPNLRAWKGEPLKTDTLIGSADYLIVPFLDYLSPPLLCAVEAKRDDFEAGEIRCLVEMYACRLKNEQAGLSTDVHGIVSNGQGWVFYRWLADNTEFGRTPPLRDTCPLRSARCPRCYMFRLRRTRRYKY